MHHWLSELPTIHPLTYTFTLYIFLGMEKVISYDDKRGQKEPINYIWQHMFAYVAIFVFQGSNGKESTYYLATN